METGPLRTRSLVLLELNYILEDEDGLPETILLSIMIYLRMTLKD